MAKFPMAGDGNNVPILFSKSQAKNDPECFFLHRVDRGYLALLKRHPERESRLRRRRGHVNPPPVGTRDFGGDV
jgi:hypothetical protein